MTDSKPTISIGLPVYNGDDYLEGAIKSILAQTFTDFELLICDNASTDRTQEICEKYANLDRRIRYHRNEENLGAARNFNLSVELARGEYFKWMAHDDLLEATYLEKCYQGIVAHPEVILSYPRTMDIDKNGKHLRPKNFDLRESSTDPTERFLHFTCVEHSCFQVFGLMKRELLLSTPMIGSYVASDRVLLVLLCVKGPFYEVPEELYYHREHPERSTRVVKSLQLMLGWFDPTKKGKKSMPYWRMFVEYFKIIFKSQLSFGQKLKCCWHMVRWVKRHLGDLSRDLIFYLRLTFFGQPGGAPGK